MCGLKAFTTIIVLEIRVVTYLTMVFSANIMYKVTLENVEETLERCMILFRKKSNYNQVIPPKNILYYKKSTN